LGKEKAQKTDVEMMARKGRLFVVSGPSGAGKSTVIDAVLKDRPELHYSISFTTRPPRGSEKNGVEYHFVTESVFRRMVDRNEFAEWAEVHGHLYGTSAKCIEEIMAAGQDVVLDIDVEGARKLFSKYPDAVSVFIAPPDMKELEKRLIKRATDLDEVVKRRLDNAKTEMAQAKRYTHVLVNEDLGRTVSEVEAIMDEVSADG
jgi:guanylate kinase